VAAGALIILETEKSEQPDSAALTAAGLTQMDDRRYGRARLHFLQSAS